MTEVDRSHGRSNMTPRMVKVPTADYKIFKSNYPAHGSWTWFVRESLRRFNDLHLGNTDEILDQAVKGVMEEMNETEISNDAGYGSPLRSEAEGGGKIG